VINIPKYKEEYVDPLERVWKAGFKFVVILIFAGIIITLVSSFWTTIPAGSVGVKDVFGKVSDTVYGSGFTLKEPYAKIRIFDMKIQKISLQNIEASDKEGQKVYADIVLNFKVKDKDSARKIYTTIGDPQTYVKTLALEEKTQEGFKGVTVKYGALEILEKRDEVKEKARQNIFNRLPVDILDVESISIIDIRYTKSFDDAIQRKKDAEQLALASEKEVAVTEAEAKKKVATAQGEKQVAILKAEAEAEALRIQKEAIANAPELLELRKIERDKEAINKWDGKLPTWITSGGQMPFINIQSPTQSTVSTGGG